MPPHRWPEPCLPEPDQLIGERAWLVVRRIDGGDHVVRIVRDDDIGEDEAPARAQPVAHATEQIRFPVSVEVMDCERRDDEVVLPLGKRIFESLDPQVCGRKAVRAQNAFNAGVSLQSLMALLGHVSPR